MESGGKQTAVPASYTVSVIIIALVALALRVPHLTESLWYDELWSTGIQLDTLSLLVWSALGDVHPPGYAILSYIWIHLFGDSELSVRMFPLLAGMGGIFLTCEIARRFISPRVGVLAGIMVALSPVHVWYSHEARAYALISTSALILVWARSYLTRGDLRTRWYVFYAIGTWIALSLHYYTIAYAGAYIVIDLLTRERARRPLIWINITGCIAVFGYIAAKYAVGYLDTSMEHIRQFDSLALWMTLFGWFPTGHAVFPVNPYELSWSQLRDPLMLGSHLLLAGLMLYGMFAGWQRCRGKQPWINLLEWLTPFGCVPVLLVLLRILGFEPFIERSLFVALPFFFILVATGLNALYPAALRIILGIALFALLGSGLLSVLKKDNDWTVYKQNADWRSANEYILEGSASDKRVIFVASPADVLLYYGENYRIHSQNSGRRPPVSNEITIYFFEELGLWRDEKAGSYDGYVYLIKNLFSSLGYDEGSASFHENFDVEYLDSYESKGLVIERYRFKGTLTPEFDPE